MRRVPESSEILKRIASATGLTAPQVERVVSALRDAIDGLFLDGYTIFAPPFSLTYPSDPVAPVFAEHFDEAADDDAEAWYVGDMEATAAWLGVPIAEYMRHPVASEILVLSELFYGLGLEDAESPEGAEVVAIARAWFDTFAEERPYRLSGVGLESDLEAWLIHHTERLGHIGYHVGPGPYRQQFVLPDRRRPDLVFEFVEDEGVLGTLIVELKATSGYLGAVDQLVGYMHAFTSLGLANGPVRGLLIADGYPPEVLAYADQKGIGTATLTELGYRHDLAANRTTTQGLLGPQPENGPTHAQQKGDFVPQVYKMFAYGMRHEREPQATLLFADDGICQWVSDERPFATFFPGHIYTLTLDDISEVLSTREFVPVAEDDPEYLDARRAAMRTS